MRLPLLFFIVLLSGLDACIQTQTSNGQEGFGNFMPETETVSTGSGHIIALTGAVLPEKKLTTKAYKERLAKMEEARARYEKDPENIDNIIWYGRRLAYLGMYKEAIDVFSIGLDLQPNNYKLLRHRGHRYIITREFDKAIEDLQQAAFYSRPAENDMEPDGLPNRLDQPITNTKFNIWYHLGIAYYLKGNYDKAISSFKQCQSFALNDDLKVAVTNWFYMTYRKIGNKPAADELLAPIKRRMHLIENYAYRELILMYLGDLNDRDLLETCERENDSLEPTLGYGIANWYLYNGKLTEGEAAIDRILLNSQWDALGYIAAEADKVSLSQL